ncbi:MAG: ABC transporter permease [Bacteroidetes bacterium]|nr:ABC transporter permease [Bacteroidota bacterium]
MQPILALIRKQFLEIMGSTQLRSLTLIAPLMQLVLFGFAASLDVKNITMAVLDYDHTVESRRLVQSFTNSEYFTIVRNLDRYTSADTVLQDGEAKMVLVIPPNFGAKIVAHESAPLQALFDGSDGNSARIASGYAGAVVASYSQQALLDVQTRLAASGLRVPGVVTQTRVWYNPDLASRRFFIPGILGLLILITTVIASSTAIVKEREVGTLEQLVVSPIRPYQIIIGKLAPFAITATITTMNLLILASLVFGISMRGNILLFFAMTFCFLVTILGLGLFISTISKTQQQASFTTSFFVLPPFLFLSGYSFPIENMPSWIQPLTYAIPLRYYLIIMRGIFLQGVGLNELWPQLLGMLAIGIAIFGASFLRFRKNLE